MAFSGLCLIASLVAFAHATSTGRIIYIAFDDTTTVKAINLATKNSVSVLHTFASGNYPTWSESAAANTTQYFYSFINDDGVTGTAFGFDVTTKVETFNWTSPYFWRVGYDPADPEHLFGLNIGDNNVYLVKLDLADGTNVTVGKYPDGIVSPSNSAVYDSNAHVFYAFLADANGDTLVIGVNAVTGKQVSRAPINDSLYVCECVYDAATSVFYSLIMDGNSDAWLAKLDPKTGAITRVGTKSLSISACDAGADLSQKQRQYFAYVKGDTSPEVTIWSLDSGDLVEHFAVENAVFGLQFFEA